MSTDYHDSRIFWFLSLTYRDFCYLMIKVHKLCHKLSRLPTRLFKLIIPPISGLLVPPTFPSLVFQAGNSPTFLR